MVVYPAFARHGRNVRSSIAAKAAPMVARFLGSLLLTVVLATVVGITLGGIAGFLVVVAAW